MTSSRTRKVTDQSVLVKAHTRRNIIFAWPITYHRLLVCAMLSSRIATMDRLASCFVSDAATSHSFDSPLKARVSNSPSLTSIVKRNICQYGRQVCYGVSRGLRGVSFTRRTAHACGVRRVQAIQIRYSQARLAYYETGGVPIQEALRNTERSCQEDQQLQYSVVSGASNSSACGICRWGTL